MTDPLLPATFPYLTIEKQTSFAPAYAFAAINSLSDTSFVPPYRLIGLTALSVELSLIHIWLFTRIVEKPDIVRQSGGMHHRCVRKYFRQCSALKSPSSA